MEPRSQRLRSAHFCTNALQSDDCCCQPATARGSPATQSCSNLRGLQHLSLHAVWDPGLKKASKRQAPNREDTAAQGSARAGTGTQSRTKLQPLAPYLREKAACF